MRAVLRGLVVAAMLCASAGCAGVALAQAPGCSKADFEAVVDEAAANLRELSRQNTPQFQAKLRHLREKRGWSQEQFLKEAAPFVRDDQIAAYDQKSEEFLARITSGGQAQSTTAAPDCALLAELRNAMKALVETQKAKWTYMFAKLDKELSK
jgi:transcriptional regulator with XRE-family HTH domain